jgi:hypothetical protein
MEMVRKDLEKCQIRNCKELINGRRKWKKTTEVLGL